jgi:hypothetical protein
MFESSMKALATGLFAAVILTGCAADTADDVDWEEDEEAVGEIEEKLLAGRLIPEREVASILRNAGFPSEVIPKMVCTAKYESSFYERASNRNRNGSIDRGLLQINSIHLGSPGCPSRANANALYTASTNASCGLKIYRSQGMGAWYGYRAHKRKCDSYRIR